jgi:hypothetical protein
MLSRFRPSAAMIVACIALFVALGGGAYALSGSNTVQSDDLGPGAEVKAADVADNAVNSADIQNGQVSVRDTNKVIPSGATITGAFRELEDDTSGGTSRADLVFGVNFYGLRAPKALTDNDIHFDDTGISAAAANDSFESSGCTGGIGIPTAPPGKVCIYLFDGGVNNSSAISVPLGFGTGFNQADDKGFLIEGGASNGLASLGGTWAYTAP